MSLSPHGCASPGTHGREEPPPAAKAAPGEPSPGSHPPPPEIAAYLAEAETPPPVPWDESVVVGLAAGLSLEQIVAWWSYYGPLGWRAKPGSSKPMTSSEALLCLRLKWKGTSIRIQQLDKDRARRASARPLTNAERHRPAMAHPAGDRPGDDELYDSLCGY